MKLTPLRAGDRAEGFGSVVRLVDGLGLKYEDRATGGPPPPEVYLAVRTSPAFSTSTASSSASTVRCRVDGRAQPWTSTRSDRCPRSRGPLPPGGGLASTDPVVLEPPPSTMT